jgi:hypothetical protein
LIVAALLIRRPIDTLLKRLGQSRVAIAVGRGRFRVQVDPSFGARTPEDIKREWNSDPQVKGSEWCNKKDKHEEADLTLQMESNAEAIGDGDDGDYLVSVTVRGQGDLLKNKWWKVEFFLHPTFQPQKRSNHAEGESDIRIQFIANAAFVIGAKVTVIDEIEPDTKSKTFYLKRDLAKGAPGEFRNG